MHIDESDFKFYTDYDVTGKSYKGLSMPTDEQRLRDHVIAQAGENIPLAFLEELLERIRRAYNEEFAEVQHKLTTLPEQRIFKLNQDRCFRIDWELHQAAKAHGLAATAKPLPFNKWHHTYVSSGTFGLTQSYVQQMGELPQPARFRDNLAEAAKCPRLPIDDPEEIYKTKSFYALFAHNPIGRSFSEEDQRLGSLMFCVPDRSMRSWAVEISVPELIASYPSEKKKISPTIAPTWKQLPKRDTGKK